MKYTPVPSFTDEHMIYKFARFIFNFGPKKTAEPCSQCVSPDDRQKNIHPRAIPLSFSSLFLFSCGLGQFRFIVHTQWDIQRRYPACDYKQSVVRWWRVDISCFSRFVPQRVQWFVTESPHRRTYRTEKMNIPITWSRLICPLDSSYAVQIMNGPGKASPPPAFFYWFFKLSIFWRFSIGALVRKFPHLCLSARNPCLFSLLAFFFVRLFREPKPKNPHPPIMVLPGI